MSALLTCISMATGVAIVQFVIPHAMMVPVAVNDFARIPFPIMFARSIAAGAGTVAFAVMFRVRKSRFIDCAVLGAITWLVYMVMLHFRVHGIIAVFISCSVVVVASGILAWLKNCPITVFLMTSLFPLLPGISFYRSVYYMMRGNGAVAMDFVAECFLSAFTIAVTIVAIQQITYGLRRFIH